MLGLQGVQLAQIIAERECSALSILSAFGKADQAMRQAKQQLIESLTFVHKAGPVGKAPQPVMPGIAKNLHYNPAAAVGQNRLSAGQSILATAATPVSIERGRIGNREDDRGRTRGNSAQPGNRGRSSSRSRK